MTRLTLLICGVVLCFAANGREFPEFIELVEKNAQAVVNIASISQGRARPDRGQSEEFERFFWRFFEQDPRYRGGPPGGDGERQSLGSGFIISKDGYVLTNEHVVGDSDEIYVRLIDRRELKAKVVGTDPRSDLALLKVEAEDLPFVKIGESEKLKVGEWVLAIGAPFGFDHSATAGIVSAKGRSLPRNRENYVPFIQTDVAINPGNSGGPLFNLDGEVVGINSQIFTRSGGFDGVSFAIPIDVAMEVVDQLRDGGRVSRGWLGVGIQEVDRDLAASFGLDKPHGAAIITMEDSTPAAKAGLQVGDVIVAFGGKPINRSADLPHHVGRTPAGSEVDVEIIREGKEMVLSVVVGELPDEGTAALKTGSTPTPGAPRLGLVVETLSATAGERLAIDQGVRVVDSSGPAYAAGIRRGDIITKIDHRGVSSVEGFEEIAGKLKPGKHVPILIVRGQSPRFMALRVPER